MMLANISHGFPGTKITVFNLCDLNTDQTFIDNSCNANTPMSDSGDTRTVANVPSVSCLQPPETAPCRRSGGRAVEAGLSIEVVQSHLPPFRNLGNFVHLTLPVSFGRDTKRRWSLLSGVYVRGSERSHTGGKCVICSGLTNSRNPNSTIL